MRTTIIALIFACMATVAVGQTNNPSFANFEPLLKQIIKEKKEIVFYFGYESNTYQGIDYSKGLQKWAKQYPVIKPIIGAIDGKVIEKNWMPKLEKRVILIESKSKSWAFGTIMRTKGKGITPANITLPVITGEILPFITSIKDGVNADIGMFANFTSGIEAVDFSTGAIDWNLRYNGTAEFFYPGTYKYELTISPLNRAEQLLPGWLVPDRSEARQIVSSAFDKKTPLALSMNASLSLYTDPFRLKDWGELHFAVNINSGASFYEWGRSLYAYGSIGLFYRPNK